MSTPTSDASELAERDVPDALLSPEKEPAIIPLPISRGTTIKDLPVDDRPREKLLEKGRHALSDAELLTILIGSGTQKCSAIELARELLHLAGNLDMLARWEVQDFRKVKGIGPARAVTIISAMELGRRRKEQGEPQRVQISASSHVYDLMQPHLSDLPHEEFWVLLLNRANKVIAKECISKGGIAGTVADPKLIFKRALDRLASGIILVHNHPSGNVKPSQQDIALTKRVKEGGLLLDISVLDHIIFSNVQYYSFADEGML